MAGMQRFATALVITYLASRDRLSVCNAGHPRPLYYRAGDRTWSLLSQELVDHEGAGQLAPGTRRPDELRDVRRELGRGDLLAFYTDALEPRPPIPRGSCSGRSGLLEVAHGLDLSTSRPGTHRRGTVLETVAGIAVQAGRGRRHARHPPPQRLADAPARHWARRSTFTPRYSG